MGEAGNFPETTGLVIDRLPGKPMDVFLNRLYQGVE
jgi:hypothetical protein